MPAGDTLTVIAVPVLNLPVSQKMPVEVNLVVTSDFRFQQIYYRKRLPASERQDVTMPVSLAVIRQESMRV